jgi:uncharacterized protein YjdB
MKRIRRFHPALVAAVTVMAATAGGCAKLETDKPATVTTAGPHEVVAGATIKLTATTTNAVDTAYTWTSADPSIAMVDATGVVNGVAPGETAVTVAGTTTGATTTHAIVVVAPDDKAQIPFYSA